MRIYIKLDQLFVNNVRGLCGTYNYKSSDDFSLPSGIVESEVNEFVNAFKLSDICVTPIQRDTCEIFVAVS